MLVHSLPSTAERNIAASWSDFGKLVCVRSKPAKLDAQTSGVQSVPTETCVRDPATG